MRDYCQLFIIDLNEKFVWFFWTPRYHESMTVLQWFFIISGIIIFLLAFDISKRQKFNALHFVVFLSVGAGLLLFTFFPSILDLVGRVFGIPRGADVLVYASIIFLMYFVLLLLSKSEKNKEDITRLVREVAILESKLHGQWK